MGIKKNILGHRQYKGKSKIKLQCCAQRISNTYALKAKQTHYCEFLVSPLLEL